MPIQPYLTRYSKTSTNKTPQTEKTNDNKEGYTEVFTDS